MESISPDTFGQIFGLIASHGDTNSWAEEVEREGRKEMLKGVRIGKPDAEANEALIAAGVILTECKEDPIFVNAKLPEGWKKIEEYGSTYWSYILDDKDVKRFTIFFKPEFYDRKAFTHMA